MYQTLVRLQRPRKAKSVEFKVDKSCRIGRTWRDYCSHMALHPDTPVVQIDSVEGIKGGNGSEFSNQSRIEFDHQGNRRTHLFYCDPSAPYQKGAAENNHEFIRRIIPKSVDLTLYSQE